MNTDPLREQLQRLPDPPLPDTLWPKLRRAQRRRTVRRKILAGGGVLASSDKQAAAEQLMAFLVAPEAQEYFVEESKEYPVIEGVDAPPNLPALDSIEQPDVNLADLDDLRGTLEIIERAGVL